MAEIENKNENVSANEESKVKSAKAEKKAKKASDKPGFFARIGKWFKSVKSEFKKITWSSRKSTFKNFGIVMVIVIASAVVIGVADVGLGAILRGLRDLCNL